MNRPEAREWCPICGSAYGLYDGETLCNGCGMPPDGTPQRSEEIAPRRAISSPAPAAVASKPQPAARSARK